MSEQIKVAIDLIKINIEANNQSIKNNFEYTPKEYLLLQNETYATIIECMKKELDRQENKALTLSELEEMVGEPVWWANRYSWIIIKEISIFNKCENVSYNVMLLDGYGYVDVEKETFYKHKPTEGVGR